MISRAVYTIGYEGRDIEGFVEQLKKFDITRVIDIREMPISRKKGFSKSALRDRLDEDNIEYIHIKALGSPSVMRNKLRSDLDYDYFFKVFSEYLSHNTEVIKEVYKYIFDGINCLMCFERSPEKCHRYVVIKKIMEYDHNRIIVKHI